MSHAKFVPNNIIIDVPSELIRSGKILRIEKHSELVLDGYHFSKPAQYVRLVHGFCLVDTQQARKSLSNSQQLEANPETNQVIRVIVQFSPEYLNAEKIIRVEKCETNEEQQTYDNFNDLFNINQTNDSIETKIKVSKESIDKEDVFYVQKGKFSILKGEEYWKEQLNPLSNNQFTKRDHLLSTHLMEVTVDVPPGFLLNDQTIAFRKEDPHIAAANFPYRRQSRCEFQPVNRDDLKCDHVQSIDKFIYNEIWNPILLENNHLLQLRIGFTDKPHIHHRNQIKLAIHGQTLSLETMENDQFQVYRQVVFPDNIKVADLRYVFDEQHRKLNINIPIISV